MEFTDRISNMRQMWMSIFDQHLTKLNITEKPNPLEILIEILYLQFQKNKFIFAQGYNCAIDSSKEENKSYDNVMNNFPLCDSTPKKCNDSIENDLISNSLNVTSEKSPVFVLKTKKIKEKKRRRNWKKLSLLEDNRSFEDETSSKVNDLQKNIPVTLKNHNLSTNQNKISNNKEEFDIVIESDDEFDKAIIDMDTEINLSNPRCNNLKNNGNETVELVNIESILECLKDAEKNNHEIKLPNDINLVSKKSSEPKYVYKREACRNKSKRMKLDGWNCENCKEYYASLGIIDERILKERMNKCSRHRSKHQEIYNTPEGFWKPEFSPD